MSQTNGGMSIAKYTLAVDRRTKKDHPEADFIRCTAFDKSADFVSRYLSKGMKIAVEGRIQTGSYDDKDGKKVYTFDVIAENHEFVEKRQEQPEQPTYQQPAPMPAALSSDFEEVIPDGDFLPF